MSVIAENLSGKGEILCRLILFSVWFLCLNCSRKQLKKKKKERKKKYSLNSTLQSVQSLSHVWLFVYLWTTGRQASLSITNSQSLPKLMSIESVMPSNHLILCCPLVLLSSIFPSIRVDKVMSLLFSMLFRLVITFLPRSKHLLISWLQSPSAVIL